MGLHYAAGPVVVVAVLALLALFLRWAFGTGSTRHPTPGDDGLLVRVATTTSREAALALRAVLADAGIRSTVRLTAAYRAEILVFPEDAERARGLAATFRS
jgi:hypothetical protein